LFSVKTAFPEKFFTFNDIVRSTEGKGMSWVGIVLGMHLRKSSPVGKVTKFKHLEKKPRKESVVPGEHTNTLNSNNGCYHRV
jgi:hypothetical protein